MKFSPGTYEVIAEETPAVEWVVTNDEESQRAEVAYRALYVDARTHQTSLTVRRL